MTKLERSLMNFRVRLMRGFKMKMFEVAVPRLRLRFSQSEETKAMFGFEKN